MTALYSVKYFPYIILKNYSKVGKTELSCNTNTYLDQYCMRSSLEEVMVTTIDNDAPVGHFIPVDKSELNQQ